jgi:hypothetical protein
MGMSEMDLPRRLARYSCSTPLDKDISVEFARRYLEALNLEIRRVALTEEHTRMLGEGPRFPASDKGPTEDSDGDSRYPWFVENYGEWCWELDAMDPNDLRDCVEDAILAELDTESWDRYVEVEEAERQAIVETCATWKSILEQDQK